MPKRICPKCEERIIASERPGWLWCQSCSWMGPVDEAHFGVNLDATPAPEAARVNCPKCGEHEAAYRALRVIAEACNVREAGHAQRLAREVLMSRGTHLSQTGRVGAYPWTGGLKAEQEAAHKAERAGFGGPKQEGGMGLIAQAGGQPGISIEEAARGMADDACDKADERAKWRNWLKHHGL